MKEVVGYWDAGIRIGLTDPDERGTDGTPLNYNYCVRQMSLVQLKKVCGRMR